MPSLLLFPVPLATVDGGMWLLGGAVGIVPTWAPAVLGTFRGGRAGLCEREPMVLARVVQGRPEDGTGAGRRGSRPACGKAPFWRQRMG